MPRPRVNLSNSTIPAGQVKEKVKQIVLWLQPLFCFAFYFIFLNNFVHQCNATPVIPPICLIIQLLCYISNYTISSYSASNGYTKCITVFRWQTVYLKLFQQIACIVFVFIIFFSNFFLFVFYFCWCYYRSISTSTALYDHSWYYSKARQYYATNYFSGWMNAVARRCNSIKISF